MNTPSAVSDPAGASAAGAERLLLIDDDAELGELLTEYLGAAGYQVEAVRDATEGVRRAVTGEHAAIVLDVMLPEIDGFEVLRRIRAKSAIPVLMLTARGEEVDRIVGLEIGADDYLPKPFNPRELVARLRAVLRRARAPVSDAPAATVITIGDLELDGGARRVRCAGRPVELTGAEFLLLETLLRGAGRIVEREELCRTVLGRRLAPYDRSIDMHVSNVRRKLGPDASGGERIKTVRGFGYVYVLPAAGPDGTDNR